MEPVDPSGQPTSSTNTPVESSSRRNCCSTSSAAAWSRCPRMIDPEASESSASEKSQCPSIGRSRAHAVPRDRATPGSCAGSHCRARRRRRWKLVADDSSSDRAPRVAGDLARSKPRDVASGDAVDYCNFEERVAHATSKVEQDVHRIALSGLNVAKASAMLAQA